MVYKVHEDPRSLGNKGEEAGELTDDRVEIQTAADRINPKHAIPRLLQHRAWLRGKPLIPLPTRSNR